MEQRDKSSFTEMDKEDNHPSPLNFDEFLPWACSQLQIGVTLIITKVFQQEYVSSVSDKNRVKKKQKAAPSRQEFDSDQDHDLKSQTPSISSEENIIYIYAVHDSNDNLVQLKFDNNPQIPRVVLRIIGLIIQYQSNLTTFTINRGMDQYTLYEIYKFLPYSHLTELCLDNAFVKEANYHTIMETQNMIKHLSLARCCITDNVVKSLADTLYYPQPSAKTLTILNLSSNRITDVGAKYLAESLRSNRQLAYLNLANNMLTDTGAEYVLDMLLKFPLSFNELLSSRSRHMVYLKEKNELALQIARDLRAVDFDRRSTKRKSVKQASVIAKKKGVDKESSLKSMVESKSITNMETALLEKASIMAENTLGEFKDPFNKANTLMEYGIMYSFGNNGLSYLNFSYNSLSYVTVKKLVEVLIYQKYIDRRPRGLVNINIEGNLLPLQCKELTIIDEILDSNLSLHDRKLSVHKKNPKKPGTK